MPQTTEDDEHKLTQEQIQWILEKVRTKLKDPLCPLSETRNWGVAPHLVGLQARHPASQGISGATYPCVVMICRDCGYSMLVNAYVFGILTHGASTGAIGEKADAR